MATYEYACAQCGGRFDVRLPIGTAPGRHSCPACGAAARRAFSPPMLTELSEPVRRLRAVEEKSRYEPDVVRQPPRPQPANNQATHPALARLPRP